MRVNDMNEIKKKSKKIFIKYGIAGFVILLLTGIIAWPFFLPIKVAWSYLPYEYTVHGTYIEINSYVGEEEEVIIPDRICFRPVKVLGLKGEMYLGHLYEEQTGVFSGCETIKKVYIPDSVEEIKEECFYECINLQEVRLSNGIEVIEDGSFGFCSSLESVIIPEGVEKISFASFVGCDSLEQIHLPESLKTIEHLAFNGCNKLDGVIIPNGTEEIAGDSFWNTKWQNEFEEEYVVVGKNILIYYGGEEEIVMIPEGVEYIGSHVFSSNVIEQLILPSSLKRCATAMLGTCENLKYVVVQNSEMIFEDVGVDLFENENPDAKLIGGRGSTTEVYAKEKGYAFLESIPEE